MHGEEEREIMSGGPTSRHTMTTKVWKWCSRINDVSNQPYVIIHTCLRFVCVNDRPMIFQSMICTFLSNKLYIFYKRMMTINESK